MSYTYRPARFTVLMIVFAFMLKATLVFGAADSADKKALPVPRFVSLATDEVNLRTGPGLRYPIRLIVRKEGLPVEVIREFDVWRQVRDAEGDEGWVHKSMLSGRRSAVLNGSVQSLLKTPDAGAVPIARLEPGVVVSVETCQEKWCKVSVAQFDGWLSRDKIWGVYPQEQFAP